MRIQTILELLTSLIICLGAVCAVPILHKLGRDEIAWAASVVIFASIPLAVGLLWKRPSKLITFILLAVLSAGPLVGIATAELPLQMVELSDYAYVSINNMIWEGYLIATAGMLTFISAGWFVALLRLRRWMWACVAHLGIVLGTFTVFATTWALMFFE